MSDIFTQFGIDISQEKTQKHIAIGDIQFADENVTLITLSRALRWAIAFNDDVYTEYYYLTDAQMDAIEQLAKCRHARRFDTTYHYSVNIVFEEYENPYSKYDVSEGSALERAIDQSAITEFILGDDSVDGAILPVQADWKFTINAEIFTR